MFEKAITFARKGNGRRLLNTLNKRGDLLTASMLDEILRTYCEIGLPKEVEALIKRRGLLDEEQYNAMAEEVKHNCSHEKYDAFEASLKHMLASGMKMNPAKMDYDNPE